MEPHSTAPKDGARGRKILIQILTEINKRAKPLLQCSPQMLDLSTITYHRHKSSYHSHKPSFNALQGPQLSTIQPHPIKGNYRRSAVRVQSNLKSIKRQGTEQKPDKGLIISKAVCGRNTLANMHITQRGKPLVRTQNQNANLSHMPSIKVLIGKSRENSSLFPKRNQTADTDFRQKRQLNTGSIVSHRKNLSVVYIEDSTHSHRSALFRTNTHESETPKKYSVRKKAIIRIPNLYQNESYDLGYESENTSIVSYMGPRLQEY